MIQWLNDWLKEIIIIILFAAFVDLILPNNTTRRYVKVVISLFILMTILSPVIRFFDSDFNLEDIYRTESNIAASSVQFEDLDQILADGETIRANHEKQSLQMAIAQIEQAMKSELESLLQTPVSHVEVSLREIENSEQPQRTEIENVKVYVVNARSPNEIEEEDTGQKDHVSLVQEIEPVSIEIQFDESKSKSNKENIDKESYSASEQKALTTRIEGYVQQHWEINAKQIEVLYI